MLYRNIFIILAVLFFIITCKKENIRADGIQTINDITIIDNFDKENLSDTEYNDWYDKMLQEEKEDYFSKNIDIINLEMIFFKEFYQKYRDEAIECYYYYSEFFDESNEIKYEHLIQLGIVRINDDENHILIETYLLPFGQHISLATTAKFHNDRFNFKTQDGWENVIIGSFYYNNDNIILEMECDKSFTATGRNFAGRIYGGTEHTLERGNYYEDIGLID